MKTLTDATLLKYNKQILLSVCLQSNKGSLLCVAVVLQGVYYFLNVG